MRSRLFCPRDRACIQPRLVATFGAFCALAAAPRVSRAQQSQPAPTELSARADLLGEAQQRRSAADHAGALDLAIRAANIQMTPSVRMFIAEEQSTLGQLAEALGNAEMCARESEHDAALRNRDAILARCRELTAELRGRIGRVVVSVSPAAPPELHVTVAGRPLRDAFLGVPFIVTPGTVAIEVRAAGFATFRRRVSVPAGGTVPVAVLLAPASAAEASAASYEAAAERRSSGGLSPAPIVVMGVGGLTLASSLVFLALRDAAVGRLEAQCTGPDRLNCPTRAMADYDNAATLTTVTNATWIAGGAVLAAGAVWLGVDLAGRNTRRESPQARIQIAPTAGGAWLGIGGTL